MANSHDVAQYVLEQAGEMTAMKLQKLVYYSQAWSLVWDDQPLFSEQIEAWANGPVVSALYQKHRGQFKVESWPDGDSANLSPAERETVGAVLEHYESRSSQWLSELTHQEPPWVEARGNLAPGERGNSVISHASMAEYYASLI